MKNKEYKKRDEFLQVYADFNNWLNKLGFKSANTCHSLDYHYSFYDKKMESLHSVEHYVNKPLNLSVRFLRGKYEHKFMLVGHLGASSELIPIEKFKEILKQQVIELRDEKMAELQFFNWL